MTFKQNLFQFKLKRKDRAAHQRLCQVKNCAGQTMFSLNARRVFFENFPFRIFDFPRTSFQ